MMDEYDTFGGMGIGIGNRDTQRNQLQWRFAHNKSHMTGDNLPDVSHGLLCNFNGNFYTPT
jgi:hypothetical protein